MLFLTSSSFSHYGLERFFSFAAEVGVDGVEIMITSNYDTQDPKYLKSLEKRYSMPIKAFSIPDKNSEEYTNPFEEVIAYFPGSIVNITSPEVFSFGYKKWTEQTLPQVCKRFRLQLNRITAHTDAMWGIIPSRKEASLHMLRQKGAVAADLSALWKSSEDIMRVPDFLREKMRVVYLSNVHNGSMYTPLPIGILPIESFLTKLARENFRGDFIFKFSRKSIHEGNIDRMIETIKESKEFFEKYFRLD